MVEQAHGILPPNAKVTGLSVSEGPVD